MKYKHWYNPKTHEVKKSETKPEGYIRITSRRYGQILNGDNPLITNKLVSEGVTGEHMHYYTETVSGVKNVRWCEVCQCFISGADCDHEKYTVCHERAMYIKLREKYENR